MNIINNHWHQPVLQTASQSASEATKATNAKPVIQNQKAVKGAQHRIASAATDFSQQQWDTRTTIQTTPFHQINRLQYTTKEKSKFKAIGVPDHTPFTSTIASTNWNLSYTIKTKQPKTFPIKLSADTKKLWNCSSELSLPLILQRSIFKVKTILDAHSFAEIEEPRFGTSSGAAVHLYELLKAAAS